MTARLSCDMDRTCTAPVTHIDRKGWIYCATHGPERRASGIGCRKLTKAELRTLGEGKPIAYRPARKPVVTSVTVTSSPFPIDSQDGNTPPPWTYVADAFRSWVWEVLLDMGKAGEYPSTLAEAIGIAQHAGYTIKVSS